MGSGFGMGMSWMTVFWLLVVVGVVLLVGVAVRAVGGGTVRGDGRRGHPDQGRSRARQMLDERYARGELTTQEYQERLQALGDGG